MRERVRERERERKKERREFMSVRERETPFPTLGNAQLVEFRWKSSLSLSLSLFQSLSHSRTQSYSHTLSLTRHLSFQPFPGEHLSTSSVQVRGSVHAAAAPVQHEHEQDPAPGRAADTMNRNSCCRLLFVAKDGFGGGSFDCCETPPPNFLTIHFLQ